MAAGVTDPGYKSMNWANRITLSRLALTVVFVIALNSSWHYARTTALVIFLIAGLTDFIDGEIARRYGVITNFGKLMDPLVDKIMMAAAFISLVPLKAVPAWAATTVVARDFLITGLRLMASAKGRVLPAERLGKQKTSWQIITVIFFLALFSIAELQHATETSIWWLRARDEAGPVLVWITVALTIYSGLGLTWRNRELIAPDQYRATGIEPAWPAWKAGTLPLSYARDEIKVARRAAKCQLNLRKVSHNPTCRSPISRMRSRPGWRCGRQNRTNYLTQRALSFRERCLACNR